MTDPIETKIYNAVHSVEPSAEFSEQLWRKIRLTPRQTVPSRRTRVWVWAPTSVVLLLALVIAVISPQKVMAAIRSWLVFIPGIGFVEEGSGTLYLQEPVTVEQDGVTLVIDQVVADVNKTVISFHYEGLPSDNPSACFYDSNQLILPDGKSLLPIGGGGSANEWNIEFSPLPAGVTGAALQSAMSFDDGSCPAPKQWNADFSLGTEAPEVEMLTVIDDPQTQPETVGSMETTVDETTANSSAAELQLTVDRVVELDYGYLLVGHVEWDNPDWMALYMDTETMTAVDANGNAVPLEFTGEEGTGDNEFAIIVASKDFTAPLSLSLSNRMAYANTENAPTFAFDAGSNPQVGQSWEINQGLEVAGLVIKIQSADVVQDETGASSPADMGYAIRVESGTKLDGLIVCSSDGNRSSAWGNWENEEEGIYRFDTFYSDGLPYGKLSCGFNILRYQIPGVWTLKWSPPAKQ